MIASAMGRGRNEDIRDLNGLSFGVRVDQEGEFLRDFHTAHHPKNTKLSFISYRHYLCDALFIVGLEGDDELLRDIEFAMKNPAYPLFLGRRACPPALPIVIGMRDVALHDALKDEPWMAEEWYRHKTALPSVELRIKCDAGGSDTASAIVRDQPLSFAQTHRRYGFRTVIYSNTDPLDNPLSSKKIKSEPQTDHDPFLGLKDFNEVE